MDSTATTVRRRKLQEQDVSSKPEKIAVNREPNRPLWLTLLFFSTLVSIITSTTYIFYRVRLIIQGEHVSFTIWTVLLVEASLLSKIVCNPNKFCSNDVKPLLSSRNSPYYLSVGKLRVTELSKKWKTMIGPQ